LMSAGKRQNGRDGAERVQFHGEPSNH
jgi:hypothetical protein